jgi:hypothetical protein
MPFVPWPSDRLGYGCPDRIAKFNVARRLPTPESDVLRGGFEQHHFDVLRRNVEGVKVLHHRSIQLPLGFEGAPFEQDDLDSGEAFPRGARLT